MKKTVLFLIFTCFTGILNAQTTKLPTNEELIEYFKETEYNILHEFDTYITAPKLDLDQSYKFKELCNYFIKIPSTEELEPIIVEKIHFKLFRDDFTYHNIKCKLDNKTHLFLITGAGRIIHQDANCNTCKNIQTKRDQFKKQITEYIAYLKERYGNLDNATFELEIPPYNARQKQRLIEQAYIDSVRNVYNGLNKLWSTKVKLHPDNFVVGFEQSNAYSNVEVCIYGYSPRSNYTEEHLITKIPANSLILETNDALWFMDDSYSDLLKFRKSFYNGKIGRILKTGRITIVDKRNERILAEFEPTIMKKNDGEIEHVQLAKFDSLRIANEQIRQQIDSIRSHCIKVSGNMFEVHFGSRKNGYFMKTYRDTDVKSNMSKFSTGYFSVETSRIKNIQQFWFFESMKKQSPLMVPANLEYDSKEYPAKIIDTLLVYETDEYIYVGDEDLPVNIATGQLDAISDNRYSNWIIQNPLSPYTKGDVIFGLDNIIRVDKREDKPQLNISISDRGVDKVVYKYKPKKK